jgi:hypothetical protein
LFQSTRQNSDRGAPRARSNGKNRVRFHLGNIGLIGFILAQFAARCAGVNPNVVPRMGDVLEKDMAYNA